MSRLAFLTCLGPILSGSCGMPNPVQQPTCHFAGGVVDSDVSVKKEKDALVPSTASGQSEVRGSLWHRFVSSRPEVFP